MKKKEQKREREDQAQSYSLEDNVRAYATRKGIGKQNKHLYVHMHPGKVCSNQVKLVTNVLYIYIMHVTFD